MEDKEPARTSTKSKPARKKSLWRLVKVLVVSILLVAVLAEIFIRVFDPFGVSHFSDMPRYFSKLCEVVGPPRIIRHKPNTTLEFRDFKITTNSLGLRDAELAETKPAGEFRLLFLGDSVVLGWGVEREALFPSLAQKELNVLAEEGVKYRCINAGHNQFDTTQEAALLKDLGGRLDPDAVVLVYVNNDVNPTIKTYEALLKQQAEAQEKMKSAFARTKGWIITRLRTLFKGINNMMAFCSHVLAVARTVSEKDPGLKSVDPEGWAASSAALLEIRDWCRMKQIPLVVMNHTLPGEGSDPPEIPPRVPFLESEGIPCFPFHFTPEEQQMDLRHSVSDAHANRLGHELLLKKLRPAFWHLGLKTR